MFSCLAPRKVVVGVDVGTGSARAGVFDAYSGVRVASATASIRTWTYGGGDFVEQSSEDIWRAICLATREAVIRSGCDGASVCGVGFDATCSLVVVDGAGRPVSVAHEAIVAEDDVRNVVVWMDHRATAEAAAITATKHTALKTVGGVVSPEMEMPKIKWLASHKPEVLEEGARLFDLADYLTWRATGDATRSTCTVGCKWNWRPTGWDRSFLDAIGLGDVATRVDIGAAFAAPGAALGQGLDAAAARDLGLPRGAAVGAGLIDAHAGGVGCVASSGHALEATVAIIAGTSCCVMCSSKTPVFAEGVWGPYDGAMVPETFLNEGGQSAAGKLLDHVVASHPARKALDCADGEVYDVLNATLAKMAQASSENVRDGVQTKAQQKRRLFDLARDVHVDPDFYGNRAPLADPTRKGAVVGLSLDVSVENLAVLYLATVLALCYQTRHILDVVEAAGHPPFGAVVLTGGLAKNPIYGAGLADALDVPVYLPEDPEAVLLGSACLAATAAGCHADLPAAMAAMTRSDRRIDPNPTLRAFHDAKYDVFRKLVDAQTEFTREMRGVPS